jgi:intraflagellar transport protein 46
MMGGASQDSDDSAGTDSSDDDSSDEDGGAGGETAVPGGYNPADYASLSVPADVKELFQYIGRYKPHNIELDTKLRCFIPDFVPAIGDPDAFLKPPRPDGTEEELGLKELDEPAATQSDAQVLELQLRALSKKSNLDPVMVRSIPHADKNPRDITKWIESIQELHRNKPPPQVSYSKAMPDIDKLMEVWPEAFEEKLKSLELPGPDLDMDVGEYAKLVCALLDIPVYDSTVQSLHVLFTLYSEFKANQHFANVAGGEGMGPAGGPPSADAYMGGGGGGEPNVMAF